MWGFLYTFDMRKWADFWDNFKKSDLEDYKTKFESSRHLELQNLNFWISNCANHMENHAWTETD